MTLERYTFVAERANPEYNSAILHAERNYHDISALPEDRLAVLSADGAELLGSVSSCSVSPAQMARTV